MNNQWTATEIARMENRRYIWHDARLVVGPMVQVWLLMAGLSLIVGLCMRVFPGEIRPSIYTLLDICGLALWLAGWPLAQALGAAMHRRDLHQRFQLESIPRTAFIGAALAGVSLALALAPCGLLLAYGLPTVLQELSTQEISQFSISLGGMAVISLGLGGASCVLASSLLALLSSRVGPKLAPLIWIALGVYFQLSAIGGLAEHIRRLSPAGNLIFSWIPPTLGALAQLDMARLADPGIRYEYVQPLMDSAMGIALGSLILLLLANLTFSARLSQLRIRNTFAIASLGGVLVAAAYVLCSQWMYLSDAAVPAPGHWQVVLISGTLTTVVLIWLLGCERQPQLADLLWPVVSLLVCMALTAPQIKAGQASHLVMLAECLVLLTVYLPATALLASLSKRDRPYPRVIVSAAFFMLVLPLYPDDNSALDFFRSWSVSPEHLYVTAGLCLLVILAVYRSLSSRSARTLKTEIALRPAA